MIDEKYKKFFDSIDLSDYSAGLRSSHFLASAAYWFKDVSNEFQKTGVPKQDPKTVLQKAGWNLVNTLPVQEGDQVTTYYYYEKSLGGILFQYTVDGYHQAVSMFEYHTHKHRNQVSFSSPSSSCRCYIDERYVSDEFLESAVKFLEAMEEYHDFEVMPAVRKMEQKAKVFTNNILSLLPEDTEIKYYPSDIKVNSMSFKVSSQYGTLRLTARWTDPINKICQKIKKALSAAEYLASLDFSFR